MTEVKEIKFNEKTINVFFAMDEDLLSKVMDACQNLLDTEYVKNNSKEEVDFVDGKFVFKKRATVIIFDSVRTLLLINNKKDFLVMYNSLEARNRDILLHQKNSVSSCHIQSPKVMGFFDEGNKYFLILKADNPLEGLTDKRTYGGLIINPNLQSSLMSDSSDDINEMLRNHYDIKD